MVSQKFIQVYIQKIVTYLLVIFIIFSLSASFNVSAQEVNFPARIEEIFSDNELAESVAKTLEKDVTDTVTETELEQILSIESYKDIENLNGIEYLKNLEKLLLTAAGTPSPKSPSDISKLLQLPKLKELSLGCASFQGREEELLSTIEQLTTLESLSLWNHSLSNINSLTNLTNLKNLSITDILMTTDSEGNLVPLNQLSLETLSTLSNLESLSLNNNEIEDISDLKMLTNLKTVYLNNNKISDFGALSGKDCTIYALNQYITLSEKQISDGSLKIDIPLISLDGKEIDITDISNNGIYNNEQNIIEWSNLDNIELLTFSFNIKDTDNENTTISGYVSIPCRIINNNANNKNDNDTTLNEPNNNLYIYIIIISAVIIILIIIIVILIRKRKN